MSGIILKLGGGNGIMRKAKKAIVANAAATVVKKDAIKYHNLILYCI